MLRSASGAAVDAEDPLRTPREVTLRDADEKERTDADVEDVPETDVFVPVRVDEEEEVDVEVVVVETVVGKDCPLVVVVEVEVGC